MREGVAREWRLMSQATVPMVPRVQRGWQRGWLESGEEGHAARIWSGRRDSGSRRMEMEAEMVTPCTFMWPSQYHKCPCLKLMVW